MNRRDFISKSAAASLAIPLWTNIMANNMSAVSNLKNKSKDPVIDPELWGFVRNMFEPTDKFINLENGYFLMMPSSTRHFAEQRTQYINTHSSWYMRREQENAREKVRAKLAEFAGSTPEETALVRNTTEAMNIIIMGYPWQKGDEVIYSDQDYGSMVEQLKQAAMRYGIVLKKVKVPMHPKDSQQVADSYMAAASDKTKLILLTHLINLSGHILPAKEIITAAHAKNIEVLVDAAHSFAHVKVNFKELGADYLGCSLHKWLCNPLGAGMLCVKKAHIGKIWPLFGDVSQAESSIKKFEHFGTQPSAIQESLDKAIDFHHLIGGELKENRLKYLQTYWIDKVKHLDKVVINTPTEKGRSCALANVQVKGLTPDELSKRLLAEYNIFTVAINHEVVKGVRITPHLYNTTQELDVLVKALHILAG